MKLMALPLQPPVAPMEALSVDALPKDPGWQYEPKWDGFRCLVFRDGGEIQLQSKAGQPLTRYFPELVEAFRALKSSRFVLDGEIAVPVGPHFSFDDLLQRIHPAESRVQKLSREHPAVFMAFDLLVAPTGELLTSRTLRDRRRALERFAKSEFHGAKTLRLSPATTNIAVAREWLEGVGGVGEELDGVIAKRLAGRYQPAERTEMVKVKVVRTADCVVGGFRRSSKSESVGSLLLGLHDEAGLLHHVGYCSSLSAKERRELLPRLEALIQPPGFTGRAPGGPSRWSTRRSSEWQPLKPTLVVEVSYDHVTGARFRHGTQFMRWRPDKAPAQCRMEQLRQ
jgi:ATP-dependent DNA ligase